MSSNEKNLKPTWTFSLTEKNVVTVEIPLHRSRDWEQWFLLSGDRHWDNPDSDQELQKVHLEEAKQKSAGVVDVGDLYCCMQGRYDPRRDRGHVREEHNVPDYIDALVTTGTDFFSPYAENFVLIGTGNHEKSILKHLEVDLLQQLVSRINERQGTKVLKTGYGGWVRFRFVDRAEGKRTYSQTVRLRYVHGAGGAAPVTKGIIQTNRRAVMFPDADIVLSGHIHESWRLELRRDRLNDAGRQTTDSQWHICVPTYKDEYKQGIENWHVERGAAPKPIGAVWLRFHWIRRLNRVVFDITSAQ